MAPRILEKSARDMKPAPTDDRPGLGGLFPPAKAKSPLAKYHILAPSAGVRVSPLSLGGMSLGDQWHGFMGNNVGPDLSEQLLDEFYNAGGNFIDTSNNYQDEQSELIIGEWMEKRQNRDEIFLATKYTTPHLDRQNDRYENHGIAVNFAGNHRKSLKHSVDRSLKKLRTDYIDLLYLHWYDHSTPVDELMQSLNDLVRAGKVLYLGISDTPAWYVAQANQYARDHALAQFVIYQGSWNLAQRDMERDIVPMCRAFGMAVAPYSVLGGGQIKTKKQLEEVDQNTGRARGKPSEAMIKLSETLEAVAKDIGPEVTIQDVALAWIRTIYPYTYPIIGGSKLEHLKRNINALNVTLSDEQMQQLDKAAPFDHGFPTGKFGRNAAILPGGRPDGAILNSTGELVFAKQPGFA